MKSKLEVEWNRNPDEMKSKSRRKVIRLERLIEQRCGWNGIKIRNKMYELKILFEWNQITWFRKQNGIRKSRNGNRLTVGMELKFGLNGIDI